MPPLRPAFLLSICVLTPPAFAEDARVTFLAKQLKSSKDSRVRAQTAVILGGTGKQEAVAPLCEALKTDPDTVVRSAAANGLGELSLPDGATCLKAAANDADPAVRQAIAKALTPKAAAPTVVAGGLYMAIDPIIDKIGVAPEITRLANELFRQKLASIGASFAPEGEAKPAAASLIKAKKLRGYLLRVNLLPGAAANGLKLEILVMTYPDQALQGSWSVKAQGAKFESLLKVMVPRVIDDASEDLEWKEKPQ